MTTLILGSSHLRNGSDRWDDRVLGVPCKNVSVGGLKAVGVHNRLRRYEMGLTSERKDRFYRQAIVMLGSNDFRPRRSWEDHKNAATNVATELHRICEFLAERHLRPKAPIHVFFPPPRADPEWRTYANLLHRCMRVTLSSTRYRGWSEDLMTRDFRTLEENLLVKSSGEYDVHLNRKGYEHLTAHILNRISKKKAKKN